MENLKKITNAIDTLNDKIGQVCSYSILFLMVVVLIEVVSRKFLNSPTLWAFEVTTMLYGFLIMMVAGYGLLHHSIVSVDLISAQLPKRTQHILTAITYIIFFFPFLIPGFVYSISFARVAWVSNEHSWSVWAPALYPIKTVIPVALFLLLLQGVSEFIKSAYFVFKGEDL